MILFKTGDLISLIYSIKCMHGRLSYRYLLIEKKLSYASFIQGVPKKRIDKKLSVGTAHDFNSHFLNLFGFSISVSFVCCIIQKI